MDPTRFASPFRKAALLCVVLVLGTAALTVPWLSVKNSVGGAPTEEASRAHSAGGENPASGGNRAGGGPLTEKRSSLVLSPVPVATGPQLASSAPAFAAPVPDRASVIALEERLGALSYMMGAKDGVLDAADRSGLVAFQKVENLPRTGQPDPPTLARLDSAQRPAPAYATPPEHLEVDVARQVVFVVRGGQVAQTLPTSTGNGKIFRSQGRKSRAVTPNGQFAITYKRNGWRRSPLGMLYRPAYFNGGIAFHGAKSVPTFPASHGCVRLPMAFADEFAEKASPPGMVVYVYGNAGEPNPPPVAAAAAPPPPPPPPPPPIYSGAAEQAPPESTRPPEPDPAGGPSQLLGGVLGGG